MASETKILRNVTLRFARLKEPRAFNEEDVPAWSVEMITYDKDQADDWADAGFTVKRIDDPDGGKKKAYRARIKRKSLDKDGKPKDPPRVVDGKLRVIPDPDIIGNGSVANLKVLFWNMNLDGKPISGRQLEGVQVIKLIPRDVTEEGEDFGEEDFVVINQEGEELGDDEIPF